MKNEVPIFIVLCDRNPDNEDWATPGRISSLHKPRKVCTKEWMRNNDKSLCRMFLTNLKYTPANTENQ